MQRIFFRALALVTILASAAWSQNKLAVTYFQQRSFRNAMEALRPDLQRGASREALNMATRIMLSLRVPDSALIFAQRSIDEKENGESLLLLTMAAREAEKLELALQTARKLVKVDPKNPRAMAEAGATAARVDSLYLATRWLIAARELNPNEPTVHEYLGDVYFKQTVWELAKGEYNDALRLDSNNTNPHWKLARIAIKQKQINEALNEYRKVYQLDSTEVEALNEIGNLFHAARQYKTAAPYYLKYLEKVPGNTKARILAAKSIAALGQYQQVIDVLQPLESKPPVDPEVYRLIADANFRMKKFELSTPAYGKLIETGKATSDDYLQMGIAFARLNDAEKAKGALLKAIELDSTNHEAHFELGLVYYKAEQYEEALVHYRAKAMLDTSSVSAILNIGFAEFQLKRFDSAAVTFTQVTKLRPDNVAGFLWLGRSFAQLDSLEAEKAAYRSVVDLSAKDSVRFKKERSEAFYSLGYVAVKQSDFTEAVAMAKRAIATDETANNWFFLAQVFANANKRQPAIDACKRTLKLDPKHIGAQKLLKELTQPAPPQPPK